MPPATSHLINVQKYTYLFRDYKAFKSCVPGKEEVRKADTKYVFLIMSHCPSGNIQQNKFIQVVTCISGTCLLIARQHSMIGCTTTYLTIHLLKDIWDDHSWGHQLPGGSVVKNLPTSVGDTGLILGPGRSHMPQNN